MDIKNTDGFPDWHFVNTNECIAWAKVDDKKYEIGPAEKENENSPAEFPIYIDGEQIIGTGTYSLGDAIHWCEAVASGFHADNNIILEELMSIKASAKLVENIILNARKKIVNDK